MKWISLILPLLIKQLNPALASLNRSTVQLREDLSLKTRTIALIALLGIAAIILLSGGLFVAALEAARQLDSSAALQINSVILTGLGLSFISLLVLIIVFRNWPGVQARKQRLRMERAQLRAQRESIGQAVSLDQAVAMLILDFIKEREEKRQANTSPLAPQDS